MLKLKGKKYVYYSKIQKGSFYNETVNILTGNDSVSARGLYSKTIMRFKPFASIILAANTFPTTGNSDAELRRFHYIHFPFFFTRNPIRINDRQIDNNFFEVTTQKDSFKQGFINLLIKASKKEIPVLLHLYKEPGTKAKKLVSETTLDGVKRYTNDFIIFTGKKNDFIIKDQLIKNFIANYEAQNFKECNKTESIIKHMFNNYLKFKFGISESDLNGRKRIKDNLENKSAQKYVFFIIKFNFEKMNEDLE